MNRHANEHTNYQIDLHMHTVASTHAYSTIDEYARIAAEKKLKMIAITDHGYMMADAPHTWHFVNMKVIPRVINGIGILRGIEANIVNIEGEIDCNDRMYEHLDMVVVGFHDPVLESMGIDKNTQAMIATIKNPKVNIISHPGNPRYPIHIEEVAQVAKEYNVALEINNSSFISRQGSDHNCEKVARAVKDAGGCVAFGSDSHIAYTVGDFSHCFELLKNVDFPADRVINRDIKTALDFFALKTGKTIPEILALGSVINH